MDEVDERMIQRAIDLGRQGAEAGAGGPFGAVVAIGGAIIGEGHNAVVATHDPTAHAEVTAIRAAATSLGQAHLTGATLYSSCEPCPMCAGAAMWAHVDRVVYASSRTDALTWGRFDDSAFWDDIVRPIADRHLTFTQFGQDRALEVWRWFSTCADDLRY